MSLNLRHLLSVSTQLSLQACNIIRQSLAQRTFNRYLKGQNDPVTDIDFKIQSMLKRGLKMHFPNLYIIGQESQQYKGEIEFDYKSLQSDIMPRGSSIKQEISLQDACLWVDPIDCTLGFLNGAEQDVTVLIGLSYRKKAYAGVVGTPFRKQQNGIKTFKPTITMGSAQHKQAYDFDGNAWLRKQKKKAQNPLRLVSSVNRRSKYQQMFVSQLGANDIRVGGAGHKMMMLVNGEADAMMYIGNSTHKWDSCAGQAIIKSLGGFFSDPYRQPIKYFPDPSLTVNAKGMVAAMDEGVYEKCMQIMELEM